MNQRETLTLPGQRKRDCSGQQPLPYSSVHDLVERLSLDSWDEANLQRFSVQMEIALERWRGRARDYRGEGRRHG
jgi:hypothetical protein